MAIDSRASIEACAAHYGEDADKVRHYMVEGQKRALALPNRGPLKFDKDGNIHSDILDARKPLIAMRPKPRHKRASPIMPRHKPLCEIII